MDTNTKEREERKERQGKEELQDSIEEKDRGQLLIYAIIRMYHLFISI